MQPSARSALLDGSGGHGADSRRRLSQLWQMPLLLLSLALFAYAAYLFIDPKPGLSVEQRIDTARAYLRHGRPDAAVDQLNKLLSSEKLARENEARVRLLLAESIETAQKQLKLDLDVNHERIVEQSRVALAQGVKPEAEIYRRLGDSYKALGKPAEALENYRRAIAMDPARALALQRKVIELQLAQADTGPAEASLEEYLRLEGLTDAERAWALGSKAELLVNRGLYFEAKALLGEARRFDGDPVAQGQVHYGLGYCAWKLGDLPEAERLLRVARDQLRSRHPLDADAAYALGRIRQDRDDHKEAVSFYQQVIEGHPDSAIAPLARLGRGVCRIALGSDEAGLTDLHDLVDEMGAKKSRLRLKGEVLTGLREAAGTLAGRGNFDGALELMAYEQTLDPDPAPDFFSRIAVVFERRAEQLEKTLPESPNQAEKIRRTQKVRDLRTKAGDAYVAYSRSVTLDDDRAHGEALWKGVGLYDRAGNIQHAISALELFVAERPNDGSAPEALLRLGRAYQAAGMFDKAISAYQRNQTRYPQSLAASKSGVPLAQAYIAKGPQSYGAAESALLRVIEDNPLITPEAGEFREALFELAQLYYRTERYEESVSRLEELTDRYPQDERKAQVLFMMADSYRKSAALLNAGTKVQVADAGAAGGAAPASARDTEAAAAKKDRLGKARTFYEKVIELHRDAPPVREIDQLHLKLSHFYRADCMYDLGRYEEAIKLYDAAALKYQDDSSSLAAYVQIVNSYCALGKADEAKTANERAKWLLRKMPESSFRDGSFSMPKAYWEQWLKWTHNAGLWASNDDRSN
jgi:tetratricopeptide (TPR) repeat protein